MLNSTPSFNGVALKYRRLYLSLYAALAVMFTYQVSAVVELNEFESIEQEARYKNLIAELRCPKCQNQNLLDSDAPIAADLRRKTKSLVDQGKSNAQIKTYMLERYGDFVLYKPRFTAATAFLWLGPFILLMVVVFVLLLRIRRKQEAELFKPSKAEDDGLRIKVRNLMSNTPSLAPNSHSTSKTTEQD